MLEALRFVKGAVARKDFHPVLTHFRIANSTIRGYNGEMALCSPINLDLCVTPQALPFIRAINACEETIAIHMTPTGRLSVRSGEFKAFVDCTTDDFPEVVPEGVEVGLPGKLLPALRALAPLTAQDASRPWAQGVLFRDCSAYATNNVVLAEYWLGFRVPFEVNLPKPAINEILRINEEPERIKLAENSCSFFFSGGRWLRTLTYSASWPDVGRVLDRESAPKALPEGLWEALAKIMPFAVEPEAVWLYEQGLHTRRDEADGVHLGLASLQVEKPVCFNVKHLSLLEPLATSIDFSGFPGPCCFFGDNLRGAILGLAI